MRRFEKEVMLTLEIKICQMKIEKEKKEYMKYCYCKRKKLLNRLINRVEVSQHDYPLLFRFPNFSCSFEVSLKFITNIQYLLLKNTSQIVSIYATVSIIDLPQAHNQNFFRIGEVLWN